MKKKNLVQVTFNEMKQNFMETNWSSQTNIIYNIKTNKCYFHK